MLHKKFKPAKCKTSLKLATSRIKLMKNKKGVQINQMKKELAQLLETGQDRTARIRVEHVIREEKMVAAYELIEIYCELIVARLPIIESQKTCPIDLKEAITSVIFAAPRCSDISELADIKKHFTAKYGKDFVSGAIELRPDCGVSRMLVEKLSAVAPDIKTKVKVLSGVAKDHNIDWDATSFEEKESKPPSDLLDGPANVEKGNTVISDPPKIQASSNDVVHIREEKRNAPFDYAEQNRKYTLGSQNINSADNDVESSSAAARADMKSSGTTSERMEMKQPFSRGENDISPRRHNWNMEFKDATSAAQAAAESAERAAIAARAAAQFSNQEKIAKQQSTNQHSSDVKHGIHHVSTSSQSNGQDRFQDLHENYSSDDQKTKFEDNQQIDRSEAASFRSDNDSVENEKVENSNYFQEYFQDQESVSTNSRSKGQDRFRDSFDDRKPKINNQQDDRNEHYTSQKATTSFISNNDSIEDEKLENINYFQESFEDQEGNKESKGSFEESEDINYFAEQVTKRQPSIHSSNSGAEFDAPDHQKYINKKVTVGNPFAVVDQVNPFQESTKTSFNDDSQKYDDYVSDDDDSVPKFDTGFDNDEIEDNIWSPRTNKSNTVDQVNSQSHLFAESHSIKSVGPSETDDYIPASFDHSDSENETEKNDIFSTNPESSYSHNYNPTKSRIELNDLVDEKESSFYEPDDESKKPQSENSSSFIIERHDLKKHNNNLEQELYNSTTLEDNKDSDAIKELKFGALTGGLRNKGYTKSETAYLSKNPVDESSLPDSLVTKTEDKKPSVSKLSSESDSDSDDFSDKFPVHSSEKKPIKQADNTKLRFDPPVFFNDDLSDSETEVTKQAPIQSKVLLSSGLSRRTRGPSAPNKKSQLDPEGKTVISHSDELYESRQPFISSRRTEELGSTESQRKANKHSNYSNELRSEPKMKQETFKTMAEPKSTSEFGKKKIEKNLNLGSEKSPGENIVKKPSHVHPKLPDYDSLAARLQSLRNNNQ